MNVKGQTIELNMRSDSADLITEPSTIEQSKSDGNQTQQNGKQPEKQSEVPKDEAAGSATKKDEKEISGENTANDKDKQAAEKAIQKEWIEVKRKPVYDFIKRAFDIIISLICLTVGLPVYLILILAIVIDDPGNPFFLQERVGFNGRVFKMIKFRTMYRDSDKHKIKLKNECASDVHFKVKNDPRITRVGQVLRRTSLDESIQAVNILLNQMTVVGPRAYIRSEQALLPDDRLQVKPGLTCYWQITDTTQMNYEDQLELDYKYIRERGIWTDLKLIGKTIKVIFKGINY